jgi:two-component system LytT family response regulator
MNLRALIVDDEQLARARLRKLLAGVTELEILGECGNGPEAISFIPKNRPDLVFLDVQMPEVSGFDVLRALPAEVWPAVIFVTAHDQHAIEAFDVHALDYLLKPFTQVRLLDAVQRARKHLEARNLTVINRQLADLLEASKPDRAYLNRIAVKNGTQTVFVRIEEVDYVESAANYAVVHTSTENHVLRETLTNLESRFPPRLFLRISRSTLVNLERVKSVQAGARGEYLVILQNGKQLLMTRGLKDIQERLQYPDHRAGGVA